MALTSDLIPPQERTAGIATFTIAYDLGLTSGSILSGLVLPAKFYRALLPIRYYLPSSVSPTAGT